MNRKYFNDTGKMTEEVTEMEDYIRQQIDNIWCEPIERVYYKRLSVLPLSDLRLWLVYSLLDHSIIKTARLFSCDRKTVSAAIERIKKELL